MHTLESVLCISIVLNIDSSEWNDLRFTDEDIKVMTKPFEDIIILA